MYYEVETMHLIIICPRLFQFCITIHILQSIWYSEVKYVVINMFRRNDCSYFLYKINVTGNSRLAYVSLAGNIASYC